MPGELGAAEIYAFARDAGFSPDQAVTMTAIALAESGGNPGAHNPVNEDSRGLWQINMEAHSGAPWAQDLDMYNPRDAAVAAWHVSQQGADIGPWTVTHTDRDPSRSYTRFADEARAAAASHGEPANGNFTGPANYGSPDVPAGLFDPVPWTHGTPDVDFAPPPMLAAELPTGEGSVDRFLEVALNQRGNRYVANAHTEESDPDPDAFDCSELVEWAAAQVGVELNEASYTQYLDLKAAGMLIPVDEAKNIPGALLFKFPDHEPRPGEGRQDGSHVAISLGEGRTIEAMSPKLGVRESEAGDRFGYAALIPGLDYKNAPATITAPAPVVAPEPEPSQLDIAAMNANSVDTDHDMLPDHFEIKYTLDPNQPDTDGDGITDGYELVVLGTKADRIDTDFDQLSDGLELVLGLDPLVADNPDPNVPLAVPDELHIDTDGDGLTAWGEETAGTDAADPDTDDDLVLDADEFYSGTNPLVADS